MEEVRTQLILENQGDRVLAEAGHLDVARVRRVELDALVDTGAVMTLLPQDVVEVLGLPLDGNIIVTRANEDRLNFHARGCCR
jgi:predicted aspartyl protease